MELIEEACPEIVATGVARVERLSGGMICIVLYLEHQGADGRVTKHTCGRIIGSFANLPEAVNVLVKSLSSVTVDEGSIRLN
jgi:hypothetical protein